MVDTTLFPSHLTELHGNHTLIYIYPVREPHVARGVYHCLIPNDRANSVIRSAAAGVTLLPCILVKPSKAFTKFSSRLHHNCPEPLAAHNKFESIQSQITLIAAGASLVPTSSEQRTNASNKQQRQMDDQ